MSRPYSTRRGALTLLALATAAQSAFATVGADLSRCARIDPPDARLACYDALAGRANPSTVPPITPAPSTPAAALRASPSAPAGAAAAVNAAAPAATADPKNFGLTPAQVAPTPKGPAAIQARIVSVSGGGAARLSVQLDNGQTWVLTEATDDSRLGSGDAVTIKHGSLGSFILATPSNHTYHVRRVQ